MALELCSIRASNHFPVILFFTSSSVSFRNVYSNCEAPSSGTIIYSIGLDIQHKELNRLRGMI